MSGAKIPLNELNALDKDAFVAALGGVFEGEPWMVAQAWRARPFASIDALEAALMQPVYDAPEERQVALIRAHPDLVGRAALAGTLRPASTAEQAAAALDRLSSEEIAQFTRLNAAYREKFGFPFVICARENKKASILAAFAARQGNTRELEIAAALGEVAKICQLRLRDMVEEGSTMSERYTHEISYGKVQVPLYRVYARNLEGLAPIPESAVRSVDNTLFAVEVDIEVFGENFLPAYTQGDNSNVVATDSMKNVVLRRALDWDGTTLESLLADIGEHLLGTYPQMERLRVTGRRLPFDAALVPAEDGFALSDRLFSQTCGAHSHAELEFHRDAQGQSELVAQRSGLAGMSLLKVTGSAFTRFVRDGYTTLPDRVDRPLYIGLDVAWEYADAADALGRDPTRYVAAEQVGDLVEATFHEFVSESIQHLVHEMGTRMLSRYLQLRSVSFAGQNRTPDPVGERADGKTKVYTSAFPAFGLIRLKLARGEE
jgi:urate oxidase